MKIDVNFDFTLDSPHYWDSYWEKDELFGHSSVDPDSKSKTLQLFHKILWSKPLPNSEIMELYFGKGSDYLVWKNFRFGSDSICASFRWKNNIESIQKIALDIPNFKKYIEDYVHKSYTIGGEIIFPKMKGGINQSRGCNPFIRDRWDLTLECIRMYYNGEDNPLSKTLIENKNFFDLFVDFKGYVDFFYLQDCVSNDYSKVNLWLDTKLFESNPIPKTTEAYEIWMDNQLSFVEKRNKRIQNAIV